MSDTIELVFNKKKYLEHKGLICPYCSSKKIEATESLQLPDMATATQWVECYDCGNTWKDIHTIKLVDVEE